MEVLKNEKFNNIIILIAFVFNISIFAPLEMYYTNKKEFWFSTGDIIPLIIICALILFGLGILLLKIDKKFKKRIVIAIIFSLLLGLYIQGNFLNLGYKVLDGSNIKWDKMISKGIINTGIWILIILIPFAIKQYKGEKVFKIISSGFSIMVILIEMITLITIMITNAEDLRIIKSGLNNNNIFNLSSDENIVVFMADTFDANYMNQILEESPEYKEKLDGFTYFDNCTPVSFYTFSSMPTLLTGEECVVGNSLKENLEHCFEKTTFYDELRKNGYNVQLYLEKALISKNCNADNYNADVGEVTTKFSTKIKTGNEMYKYVLFRYLPHFLKPNFVVSEYTFNDIKLNDNSLMYKYNNYYLDDVGFNQALLEEGIEKNEKNKSFRFYQLNGLHVPYNTQRDITYNTSDEYQKRPAEEKRYDEGYATINILCNYINELKKAGVYDNTTIIFLADHGYENRFYPTLLVKKANSKHEFETNSAPVSMIEDLIPTILNIASDSKDYGKDFFDYSEGEERTRTVLDYTYSTMLVKGNVHKVISKITFETKGESKDKNSFYIVGEEYENDNKELKKKYSFGDRIAVKNILNADNINLTGFVLENLATDIETGWNIGKDCRLTLRGKTAKNDVTAKFYVSEVLADNQRMNIKMNGRTIYTVTLNKTEEKQEVTFKIPKEEWNKKEKVEIDIEFPDACLDLYHATMMAVMHLESLVFYN